jgi:hypothetical protein
MDGEIMASKEPRQVQLLLATKLGSFFQLPVLPTNKVANVIETSCQNNNDFSLKCSTHLIQLTLASFSI